MFKMKIVVGSLQYLEGVFPTFQAHILFSKSPSKENIVLRSDQARVLNIATLVYMRILNSM